MAKNKKKQGLSENQNFKDIHHLLTFIGTNKGFVQKPEFMSAALQLSLYLPQQEIIFINWALQFLPAQNVAHNHFVQLLFDALTTSILKLNFKDQKKILLDFFLKSYHQTQYTLKQLIKTEALIPVMHDMLLDCIADRNDDVKMNEHLAFLLDGNAIEHSIPLVEKFGQYFNSFEEKFVLGYTVTSLPKPQSYILNYLSRVAELNEEITVVMMDGILNLLSAEIVCKIISAEQKHISNGVKFDRIFAQLLLKEIIIKRYSPRILILFYETIQHRPQYLNILDQAIWDTVSRILDFFWDVDPEFLNLVSKYLPEFRTKEHPAFTSLVAVIELNMKSDQNSIQLHGYLSAKDFEFRRAMLMNQIPQWSCLEKNYILKNLNQLRNWLTDCQSIQIHNWKALLLNESEEIRLYSRYLIVDTIRQFKSPSARISVALEYIKLTGQDNLGVVEWCLLEQVRAMLPVRGASFSLKNSGPVTFDTHTLTLLLMYPRNYIDWFVIISHNEWIWDVLAAQVQNIPKNVFQNVLDHVAAGCVEFWQHKRRIPLKSEFKETKVLAHLIAFTQTLYDIPISLTRSAIVVDNLLGTDLKELALICRDLFHDVDIKKYEERIKAIWKRNRSQLTVDQIDEMLIMLTD